MAKKARKTTSTDHGEELRSEILSTIVDKLPSVDDGQSTPEPELGMRVETITLHVPVSQLTFGYEPRRCDVSSLTGEQRRKLRKVTNGLIAKEAVLKNGRVVNKPQDAIKWMLESLES